ncbi:MAG TPA: PilX N-terminal domain-containing pilus assembly protein, partial [Gammaproteobacteria bacterium]|nr:PilX N-terminal domain-containing pilus assembly protein [Gammaproteobacteria bacterium]
MNKIHSPRQQRGAALFVALILLIVITILAVSTMGTSRLELRMAGNTQFSVHAFQAAQSAIENRISA